MSARPNGDEREVWLIAGLGNPGREYRDTRHNLGFLAVDRVAVAARASAWRDTDDAHVAQADTPGGRIYLAKPTTYMNESGPPVAALARFYKIPVHRILVIVDDAAIPLGRLRLRASGSAGGHNGLKSLIAALGTQDFARLRIGIGPAPAGRDLSGFVLGKLKKEEKAVVETAMERLVEAVRLWREKGPAIAANFANAAVPEADGAARAG